MAMIYGVRDGPRGTSTSKGHEITIPDLTDRLMDYQCRFLGSEPPSFNSGTPSDYYRHVVIEVCEEDQLNEKFDQVGFYVIADLDPTDSNFLYVQSET